MWPCTWLFFKNRIVVVGVVGVVVVVAVVVAVVIVAVVGVVAVATAATDKAGVVLLWVWVFLLLPSLRTKGNSSH